MQTNFGKIMFAQLFTDIHLNTPEWDFDSILNLGKVHIKFNLGPSYQQVWHPHCHDLNN